jgi:hypothetical protein
MASASATAKSNNDLSCCERAFFSKKRRDPRDRQLGESLLGLKLKHEQMYGCAHVRELIAARKFFQSGSAVM